MDINEVFENARAVMGPKCRVCPDCNGAACRGKVPGVGGVGNGMGFTICREYLSTVKICMDTVCEPFEPDTTCTLLGRKCSMPLMISPIGGMAFNYNGYLTDVQYNTYILQGAETAGIIPFTGDTPDDAFFDSLLPLIKADGGKPVSTVKPWANGRVLQKAAALKDCGCEYFAMDVDSAGLPALAAKGKPGLPKSIDDILYLREQSGMNVIIKGILSPRAAEKAAAAGAAAIIVSSHGGRHYQDAPATASLLPEIRRAVGPGYPVFVDGGIRSGADIFKVLALGADAAMIGRPFAISAHGGGAEGVALYAQKLQQELRYTMLLAGCKTLSDITAENIRINA